MKRIVIEVDDETAYQLDRMAPKRSKQLRGKPGQRSRNT
jgi:hypothetical protein